MKKLKLLVVFTLTTIFVSGQSGLFNKSKRKIFLDGESYYIHGDYVTAINTLKPLVEENANFKELPFIIGNSYFQLKDSKKAKYYLEKAAPNNADAHFLLAHIHLANNDLDSANIRLLAFNTYKDDKNSLVQDIEVEQLKRYIENAVKYQGNAEIVNISNLGKQVNSEYAEYVPLISSDEELLIFTSRRPHKNNDKDPFGQPYEDVYFAEMKEGKQYWTEAELLKGKVNTPTNDACVGLSPDGNKLFVFRTNKNLIGGDLYESVKIKGKWSEPIKMDPNINNEYTIEPSASISLDGRILYFSSNREGGYGGFDIYRVVKLPNGEWSEALNLGKEINTPFDEDSPFIHPNGKTLYFSSEGHASMGGFDIFKSEKEDTTWRVPENLGFPTNTTKDDVFFTISANEQHGYYSSNKEGGFGSQDIYKIDYLEKRLRQSVIRATVKNTFSQETLVADITLIDVETGELAGIYVSHAEDGRFIFVVNPNIEYEIIVEVEGYEEYSDFLQFNVVDLMETQRLVFYLTPISD